MTYQLTADGKIIKRLSDGASIPADERNGDYREFLRWKAAGNEPLQVPQPTADEIKADLEAVLDAHVDATAHGMGYRSSESCAGYAASTDPVFQAEALAFIAWRDDLWRTAIAIMQAVLAGQRRVPTREEFLAEMPVFVRPGQ